MRFYVPLTDGPAMAERVWQATRRYVAEITGLPITERRIEALHCASHNGAGVLAVGDEAPRGGESVLIILESEGGPFLLCTKHRGVLDGAPCVVPAAAVLATVEFSRPPRNRCKPIAIAEALLGYRLEP
jgi:hypothetical protein